MKLDVTLYILDRYDNGPFCLVILLYSILIKLIKMIVPDGQQKRLVQSYKITNKQLRKQLENLNNEIDKIIAAKTNRLGLKKLPQVDKNILKTNDIKLLQVEVDNLRKRLEHVNRDNELLKQRIKVNHMQRAKQLEVLLQQKIIEKQSLRKEVYYYEKSIQTLNTTDLMNEEMKLYDKIQQMNQELIRTKKIQAELIKNVEEQKLNQQKKTNFINQSVEKNVGKQKQLLQLNSSKIELPVTHNSKKSKEISQEEWKQLKKQFLQLKQNKQRQQGNLNELNDSLRMQIRNLQLKMKHKKSTIQNIYSHEIKRKERNYSTLDNSKTLKEESIRYRNKNNKYSTKN